LDRDLYTSCGIAADCLGLMAFRSATPRDGHEYDELGIARI
jgi:hypothetical protein